MPTTLTTPIAKNETQATLDAWSITVVRNGALAVDLPNTTFGATLSIRYADGTFSRRVDLSQNGTQLSAAAVTAIRNFHNALITYLRTQGLLPAGSDTSDF
jgi:hypothetical protein